MTSVLLIDKQELTQLALTQILAARRLTVNVADTRQLIKKGELISETQPKLLIADPFFDSHFSLEDLIQVAIKHPQLPVLVLFNQLQRADILKLVDTGFKCLLSKTASHKEVVIAVETALLHKKYFCDYTSRLLFGDGTNPVSQHLPSLSTREKEIIYLIAEGLPDTAIAEKLFLSFHTVRTHRKNITKKLGFSLKNAAELVWLVSYLNNLI